MDTVEWKTTYRLLVLSSDLADGLTGALVVGIARSNLKRERDTVVEIEQMMGHSLELLQCIHTDSDRSYGLLGVE